MSPGGTGMQVFDYALPTDAIAQRPLARRDAARLLVANQAGVAHHRVADLADLLHPEDLLVVNDSRVLPARLRLRKPTGGAAEVLLLEPIPAAGPGPTPDVPAGGSPGRIRAGPPAGPMWRALVRPGRRLAAGTILVSPTDGAELVRIGERLEDGCRAVELLAPPWAHGQVPLPPYIRAPLTDSERYQTVYSRRPGSVAAPTAGLHLTEEVLERCRQRGVGLARVELMVGLGTFRPITADDPADHVMHSERYRVPAATMEACRAARRVVAVGTTTVRALEAAATGQLEGRTSLFIRGDYPFAVVDVLLTNFHQPRSSLLLLVDAFCGPQWRDLYLTALAEGYRFLSFGDAMLVERHR